MKELEKKMAKENSRGSTFGKKKKSTQSRS